MHSCRGSRLDHRPGKVSSSSSRERADIGRERIGSRKGGLYIMDRWKNILKKEEQADNELRGVYKRVGGWEGGGGTRALRAIQCFDHPHAIHQPCPTAGINASPPTGIVSQLGLYPTGTKKFLY